MDVPKSSPGGVEISICLVLMGEYITESIGTFDTLFSLFFYKSTPSSFLTHGGTSSSRRTENSCPQLVLLGWMGVMSLMEEMLSFQSLLSVACCVNKIEKKLSHNFSNVVFCRTAVHWKE